MCNEDITHTHRQAVCDGKSDDEDDDDETSSKEDQREAKLADRQCCMKNTCVSIAHLDLDLIKRHKSGA